MASAAAEISKEEDDTKKTKTVGVQPGGKRKLQAAQAGEPPAKTAKCVSRSDGKEEHSLRESSSFATLWIQREFASMEDAKADDDAGELRRMIREIPIRIFLEYSSSFTSATQHFIERLDLMMTSDPKDVSLCELCMARDNIFDEALALAEVVCAAMELSLLLRLAKCLGVTFSDFTMPIRRYADAEETMAFCSHISIMAVLAAGHRLSINWDTPVADEEMTWGLILCQLRDKCDTYEFWQYGLTKLIIAQRIVHVVGERGAFCHGSLRSSSYPPHPLWTLAGVGGLWQTFREYEYDDASPYRYPMDYEYTSKKDVDFALRVNARRDEYRGVLRRLPMFSDFIARLFNGTGEGGVAMVLWPVVISYLFSPELYTPFLPH